MFKSNVLKLLIIFLPLISFAQKNQLPFTQQYNQAKRVSQLALDTATVELLNQYHFVFVGGFSNEIGQMRGNSYFKYNVEWLKEAGLQDVSILFPSSFKSVKENIPILTADFLDLYEAGKEKPLIIIGHSKGGLESLATVIANPFLIEDGIIQRVITAQSPLRGCHMGDQSKALLGPLSNTSFIFNGLNSLTTQEIKKVIEEPIKEMTEAQRTLVSEAVSYVISSQKSDFTSPVLTFTSKLFDQLNVKQHDGVVGTMDMYVPDFGRVIAELRADHLELFVQDPFVVASAEKSIKAFSYTLVKNVLELEGTSKNRVHKRPVPLPRLKVCALAIRSIF